MAEASLVITGACGYIGSVLSKFISNRNVTLIDRLDYGSEGVRAWGNTRMIQGDFSDYEIGDQTLVHLASPRLGGVGFEEYVERTKKLFESCRSKIVFASSCSVYGPQDEYVKAKLELEQPVLDRKGVVLRFATAYGDSPVPREDLMINNFVARAKHGGKIEVFNPKAVRPFVHVMDIARGIVWGLTAPSGIYNIGGENWRKGDVAKEIASMTGCEVVETSNGDPRDYSASFEDAQRNGYHAYWALEHWLQEKLS